MSKTLHCSIITPEQQVFDANATSVVLPAHDGLVGILHDHAPLLCEMGTGVLKIETEREGQKEFYVDGGFAQVLNNDVTVLTERAAAAEDISKAAANQAMTQAHTMRITDEASLEAKTRAVARAQAQLKIAKK